MGSHQIYESLPILGGEMKIAILSDIHANIDGFLAVIESDHFRDCELKINAGDSIGYYLDPVKVVNLLQEYEFISVKGNHEEIIENAIKDSHFLNGITAKYGIGHKICLEQLGMPGLNFLSSLPFFEKVSDPKGDIYIFHGSPRSTNEYLYPDTELEQIERLIPDGCKWLILGNTHWPMLRTIGSTTIINPGSVGQPRNGSNNAQWAILDTNTEVVTFLEENYDSDSLIEKLKDQQPLFPKLWEVFQTK
jgi:predicted phosphodiesterase